MAVGQALLEASLDDSNASSYATGSVTPGSNRLVLIAISSSRGTSGGEAPSSVTGCGLTWEKVDERVGYIAGSTPRTLTLWRALGASPTTGAITINFTNAMTACSWVVSHHDGVDTSGTNGSGAIVQSVDNGATSATPSATLAAFASTDNATYGCIALGASAINIAAGTGFTEIGEANSTAPVNDCQAQFRADNDTSVDWGNLGSSVAWGVIAVEIKAAVLSITPTGLARSHAFGTVEVQQSMTPTGLARSHAFGTVEVQQSITPTGLARSHAFGTVTATEDTSQTITPDGLARSHAFGTVEVQQSITPTGLASSHTFGTVELQQTITPTGLASSHTFGTVAVQQSITPTGLARSHAFGTVTVTFGVAADANRLNETEVEVTWSGSLDAVIERERNIAYNPADPGTLLSPEWAERMTVQYFQSPWIDTAAPGSQHWQYRVLRPSALPPPPDPDPDTRLLWLPAFGTGCLTGFSWDAGGTSGRSYDTELAKMRAVATGYTPAVSREFFPWGISKTTVLNRASDRAALGIPRIILNLSSRLGDANRTRVPYQDIIDGDHDAWIDDIALSLNNANRPVVLLYQHEPHAGVVDYSPVGTSYEDACLLYIEATRHIITRWQAQNSITTYAYQSTEFRLSLGDGYDCYAGDDYIDLVGYTGANGNTQQNPWKTPQQRAEQARDFIESTGKPGAVFAGGSAEGAASPGDKVSFYHNVTDAMQNFPQMRLYTMVSTIFADTNSVQWIDTTPQSLAKWQEVVQRPYHNPPEQP